MSKISLFIPLAVEYDPEEVRFKESFSLSDVEVKNLFVKIYNKKMRASNDGREERPFAIDLFMEEVQNKRVSGKIIMFLAASGFYEMYIKATDGLSMYYFADRELEDKGQ